MSQRQPVPAATGQAPQSEIPDELIEAYRATEYVCGLGHDAFVLRIGVPSFLHRNAWEVPSSAMESPAT